MSLTDQDRWDLITRGLEEAKALLDVVDGPMKRELRERLDALQRTFDSWVMVAPTRIARAAMVNSVLELNLDAMKLRRERKSQVDG